MDATKTPLTIGNYFHVYNRGNNGDMTFYGERHYRHFLRLYAFYLSDFLETYAYCLLPNHFHLMVRIKEPTEDLTGNNASEQFRRFFIAYTKAINLEIGRTGSLFENRFKRLRVIHDAYFNNLVRYVHRNAQHHGYVDDFRAWPWCSYGAMLSERPTRLARADVLAWFGGKAQFEEAHGFEVDESVIEGLIGDDFV